MHLDKATCAATDIAMLAGGIAEDQGVRRHVARHNRTRPDKRESADCDAADNDCTSANRSAIFDQRWSDLPVISTFQLPIRGNSAWKHIIGETDVGADEHA